MQSLSSIVNFHPCNLTALRVMHEQVNLSKIRQRLSSKHQEIAERLTSMLTKSVKDQAQVKATLEQK